ncbi:Bromodomain transcription factor [Abeliophyllum distichum]|uniref:Bromodomain transcription factor n=1 Tax=Abeliophyllum distichum TaxID=126358 RepID=A0ABD1UHJ8_9LAMI
MNSQYSKPINIGPLPEPEFSFTVSKVASAQICQSMGFKAAQNSALEVLTDIATRYLKAIAMLAVDSANSLGRTETNLFDIIVALEDLGSVRGFRGGSDTKVRTLYESQVIRDLMVFVKYKDEIPFAQPLPRKMISWSTKGNFSKFRGDVDNNNWYWSEEKLMHVPRWLPLMPEMGGEEKGEERKGKSNRKWGCLDSGFEFEGEGEKGLCRGKLVEREGSKEIELLGDREKVRFKLGVDVSAGIVGNLRGRVCRGGGIGKRVLCKDWNGSGGSKEDKNKRMIMAMNKRS